MKISIHALLAESDRVLDGSKSSIEDFYPRSPCGERPALLIQPTRKPGFLSTLSLRRATLDVLLEALRRDISIHALLAESDVGFSLDAKAAPTFLSTLSLRRATSDIDHHHGLKSISIHALLAESDSKSAQNSGALLRI